MATKTISPIFEDKKGYRKTDILIVLTTILFVSFLLLVVGTAVTKADTVKTKNTYAAVSDCQLKVQGARLFYLIGPRVPVSFPLPKATDERVYDDFLKTLKQEGDIRDFVVKYSSEDDYKRISDEYRNTLVGLYSGGETINELFYGGDAIAPMRLSCKICDEQDCRMINLDTRITTTRLY